MRGNALVVRPARCPSRTASPATPGPASHLSLLGASNRHSVRGRSRWVELPPAIDSGLSWSTRRITVGAVRDGERPQPDAAASTQAAAISFSIKVLFDISKASQRVDLF